MGISWYLSAVVEVGREFTFSEHLLNAQHQGGGVQSIVAVERAQILEPGKSGIDSWG